MRNVQRATLPARHHTPLAVRGSSPRTFRGIGFFLEAGLLFCGGYLLAETMLSPLSTSSVSLLGGGLFLALASVLLFYLLWPTYIRAIYRQEVMRNQRTDLFVKESASSRPPSAELPWKMENEEDLPGPM